MLFSTVLTSAKQFYIVSMQSQNIGEIFKINMYFNEFSVSENIRSDTKIVKIA